MCIKCNVDTCGGCDCVNCDTTETIVVKTKRKKASCDTTIDMIKELLRPEVGSCNIQLKGTYSGTNVVLISSKENCTFSSDGINFQNSNVFHNQKCGNNAYFVKDDAGCLASLNLAIDCNCSPEWRPKEPLSSQCINSKLNILYVDGCGSEKYVSTDASCTGPSDFCNKTLSVSPVSINCISAENKTRATISVFGNDGNQVQFFNPNINGWEDGNLSLNSHVIEFPSNGQTYQSFIRLKGCQTTSQYNIKVCEPTTEGYSKTRTETINCPSGCAQETIQFSKVYTGPTQVIADTKATTDVNFYSDSIVFANENCQCGSFSVSVISVLCEV